jgi:hypothetical protein
MDGDSLPVNAYWLKKGDLSLFFAYYVPEVDLFLKQDGCSIKCQKKTQPQRSHRPCGHDCKQSR